MKSLYAFLIGIVLFAAGCTKDETIALLSMQENGQKSRTYIGDDEPFIFNDSSLVLGRKLANPYSVTNMNIARDSLIAEGATPSSVPTIKITHNYVRFKPADEEALARLKLLDTTIAYYEYPLDYEIAEHGVSYHDPAIPDTLPTYQYAAIPLMNWINMQDSLNMEYEIIENLCILDEPSIGGNGDFEMLPDPDPNDSLGFKPMDPIGDGPLRNRIINSGDDYDESAISALMTKSFALTGNGDYEDTSLTRASNKWTPSGTIRAYDNIVDGYIPLEGVKVRARRWFTTHTGITDKDGKFRCDDTFKRPANYSIIWERGKYDIRDGHVGQAYYNGPKKRGEWNLDINSGKSIRFATIHRAAYRTYYGNTSGLNRPVNSRKEKIAYINRAAAGGQIGDYNRQWGMGVWSDIRIFGKETKNDNSERWLEMSEIIATTFHELGHAAHYTIAKSNFKKSTTQHIESWARFVEYLLTMQEYKSLNAYDKYSEFDSKNNCYKPDNFHNWQSWYKEQRNITGDSGKFYSTYTPLYIDLYDGFNQYEYFLRNDNYELHAYPNDQIHMMPIVVQTYVFNNTSFATVKQALLEYVRSNKYGAQAAFNLTEENINLLFSYYE